MTTEYYPFEDGPGASVTESQWELMARNFRRSGVGGDAANISLKVLPSSNALTSTIEIGECWIVGHQFINKNRIDVQHEPNVSGLPRIDVVAIRKDSNNNTIGPVVIKGTPSANPTPPATEGNYNGFSALEQPGPIWDLPLAHVRINHNQGVIPASAYTDMRWFSNVDLTTGTSSTRNNYWGMRPFGSIHYEYDTRRWVGWDGYKWGMVAETGPWRTWTPRIYWAFNSGPVHDTGWTTVGRWRYIADNTVAFSLTAVLDHSISKGSRKYPDGAIQITLPVNSGQYADYNDTIIPLIYNNDVDPSTIRTGVGIIWPNSDRINRVWFNHVSTTPDSQAGTLDGAHHDGGWPKSGRIRMSGIYETAGV